MRIGRIETPHPRFLLATRGNCCGNMEKTFEAWQDYGNGRKKRRRRRSRAKKLPVVPPSWRPLSQRLSPNRSCFDSELKARWEGMSKAEKKEMLKEDRKMLKAWKIQRGKSTVAKVHGFNVELGRVWFELIITFW